MPNYDMLENFEILNSPDIGNYLYLHFHLAAYAIKDNKTIIFLRYKDGTEDTLIGEFNSNRNEIIQLQKVWLNNQMVWHLDAQQVPSGNIIIIK